MQELLESAVDVLERTNHTRMEDPLGTIQEHFEVFQGLVRRASRLLAQARYQESAVYAQVAAEYAWFHPTGLLASPELDTILVQIGATLPRNSGEIRRSRPNSSSRNVLHVLTEAYGLGGHTRFVWRWIQNDVGRRHSVVLTRQGEGEVPDALKANAEGTGGEFYYLDRYLGGFLARVQVLRRLAAEADHVVLHTHPHDVIPLIAFAGNQDRPPVTLMNHADHVFWLGGGIVDQVAHFRESSRRLSQQRRGLAESRCPLVPIPLEASPKSDQRTGAKSKLRLSEDTVVLLTIASSYKYASIGDVHFANVVLPILQKHQNTVLFVIGPEESDEWTAATGQANGRMRVLGKRADTSLFYQAADIYLDSFPFGSLTSVLEAGSHGNPIVSYRLHPKEAEVLYTEDPALTPYMVHASSVEEYRTKVSHLIEDGESRRKLGRETKKSIIDFHEPCGWNRFVDELYSWGGPASSIRISNKFEPRRHVGELDIRLAQIFAKSGRSKGLCETMRNHVALFPLRARLGIWRQSFGGEWNSLPRFLLNDWQKTMLNRLRSHLSKRIV